MNNHDLERLATICRLIDHMEQHGVFTDAWVELRTQRDALLSQITPKPAQQAQAKKR